MPPQPYPGPDAESILSALQSHARYYAAEFLDYPLESEAQAWLEFQLRSAVTRMAAENRLDEDAYMRARRAVEALLMRAGPERLQESVEPGPARIREADLSFSLRGLCPGFWPFC